MLTVWSTRNFENPVQLSWLLLCFSIFEQFSLREGFAAVVPCHMGWPPWAPPRVANNPPPTAMRTSMRSGSVAADDVQALSFDALGMARVLRTEALTAICLLIVAACALGFMLFFLRTTLIPFAIAVFLMYLLQPMVNYLCKPPRRWCDKCSKKRGEVCCEGMFRVTKSRTYSVVSQDEVTEFHRRETGPKGWGCLNTPVIPRWIAVILAIAVMLSALGTLGVIVYGSVLNLQADFGKYEVGANRVGTVIDRYLRKYNYSLNDDFMPFVLNGLRAQVPRVLRTVLSSLQYFFLVAIFLVYLLISPIKPIKSSVWGIIDLHIRRYIRLKTMVGVLAGVVVTAMLWVLGVHMAYVFGLVTFGLNFVPNLGPLIATLLPMPLVIFDPDLPTLYQVLAFALPTLAHMVIGNFVEPWLFGESFELSPVVVLLSLAFWGSLWGIPGMILAVPLIVIARIVCDHLEHPYAKTLMRLLEGNVFEARNEDGLISAWSSGGVGGVEGMADLSWGSQERPDEALAAAEMGDRRRSRSRSGAGGKMDDEQRRNYGSTSA